MSNIIQTIRLIRRKEDEYWSVYLLEFFKLIGCIVFDNIVNTKDDEIVDIVDDDKYDVNIFFNINDSKNQIIKLKEKYGNYDSRILDFETISKQNGNSSRTSFINMICKKTSSELNQLIANIWNDNFDNKAIAALAGMFSKSELFFYSYNKGNLKFVQEYYPLNGEAGNISEKRKKACVNIYNMYADFYNELIMFNDEDIFNSYYYQYTLLNIRYELNSIRALASDRTVFYTDALLQHAERIKEKYRDAIRIHFLNAKICKDDERYIWDAEIYFIRGINMFTAQYNGCKAGEFLYYQLAHYYEKKRRDCERAIKYYRMATNVNARAYRAIYKLAKAEELKKNYRDSIDLANQIINIVLNGYGIENLMPKQRLYVYKSYILLGDAFAGIDQYDLSVISYERAYQVAEKQMKFFEDLSVLHYSEDLYHIMKACMPKQQVYSRLISSASRIQDMERVEKYQNLLFTGEDI